MGYTRLYSIVLHRVHSQQDIKQDSCFFLFFFLKKVKRDLSWASWPCIALSSPTARRAQQAVYKACLVTIPHPYLALQPRRSNITVCPQLNIAATHWFISGIMAYGTLRAEEVRSYSRLLTSFHQQVRHASFRRAVRSNLANLNTVQL